MTTFEIFCLVAECCLAFFGALLASLAITPVVRSRAEEWGFVDQPDGGRKAHRRAIALGGGVAVLVSALAVAGVTFSAISARHVAVEQAIAEQFAAGLTAEEIALEVGRADEAFDVGQVRTVIEDYQADPGLFNRKYNTLLGKLARTSPFYFGLLASAILICAIGLLDDFVQLPGRYKLAGQVVAALILVASGLLIEKVTLFDRLHVLGILAVPFTLFWLLGAINAINLLDGIDGLASSVGFILSLTLAVLALFFPQAKEAEAIIALVLAGSLLGFLRFNFAPATIFLGDSGSMLIGLVIGAIAIRCSFKEAATVALAVPFALWAVPIFDSLAAILRRKLTGRSLFATDRAHLHHSLLVRGWSVPQTVLFIGVICATTCLSALLSFYFQNELIAWFTVAAVVALLILMGIFGHVEFALVKDRVRSTTRAFSARGNGTGKHVHESRIRLQGSLEWDHLWSALTESAEHHNLTGIELTLNLPAYQEAFYANWHCSGASDTDRTWRVVCPLFVSGQPIGSLVVRGVSPKGSSMRHIRSIADFLDPVEESISRVMVEVTGASATVCAPEDHSQRPAGDQEADQHPAHPASRS